MAKISSDDNNLSKMHPFPNIWTDRISEGISAHVADESIKILLCDDLPMWSTNTWHASNEIIDDGA